MRLSRSRRKSGPGAVLSGFRKALVWGVLILIALKANAPKRLLELYQSLSGASGRDAGQPAGGSDTPTAGTPSVADDSDDQGRAAAPEDNASETENVAASSTTGEVGLPGDRAASDQSDQKDDDTGADDTPVTSGTGDTSAVESGDIGSLDDEDVRNAESGVIGFGDDEAAAEVGEVSTEAGDAAGYGAPDAQGLILIDKPDISDRESGDVGAAPSAADTGVDTAGTPAPAEGSGSAPGNEGAAHRDVAGLLEHAGIDSADQSGVEQRTEHTPGMVTDDEDAVPGDGTTECPEEFPIKGNGRSRLYHMPEGFAYSRTKPEVCFRTPEAAEKAGFRRAKG